MVNTFVVGIVCAVAIAHLHVNLSAAGLLIFPTLVLCGVLIHYALLLMLMSLAFWMTRAQGFINAYYNVFQIARLPREAFHGTARIIFTWTIPLLLIANVPARTLLYGLDGYDLAGMAAATAVLLALSTLVFPGRPAPLRQRVVVRLPAQAPAAVGGHRPPLQPTAGGGCRNRGEALHRDVNEQDRHGRQRSRPTAQPAKTQRTPSADSKRETKNSPMFQRRPKIPSEATLAGADTARAPVTPRCAASPRRRRGRPPGSTGKSDSCLQAARP